MDPHRSFCGGPIYIHSNSAVGHADGGVNAGPHAVIRPGVGLPC